MSVPSPVLEHIHPGHPITVAVDIMRRYPSFAAAMARNTATTEPVAAMRNAAIPGSAATIQSALELLDFALDGHVELGLETATEMWGNTPDAASAPDVARGAELASEHAQEFRARIAAWPRHNGA